MAYYIKWNDDKTDYTVWGGASIGVKAMTERGFERVEVLPERPVIDPDKDVVEELNTAYADFRSICADIGRLIGNPDFTGGFDEMKSFSESPASQTAEGIALSIKWIAADKLCTYLAGKLGIGQPDWWYQCWEQKGE